MAQALDYALTVNKSASGGVIAVDKSTTNARPTHGQSGDGRHRIGVLATGDITVKALSTNDADATNNVVSGGALNIGTYGANARRMRLLMW